MEPKVGVIHYNFPKEMTLEGFFAWCRDAGCRYVEIQRPDVWNADEPPEKTAGDVARMLERYGLAVSQVTACNDFIQKTPDEVRKQLEMLGTVCRLAKIVGARQLRMDGGWPKEGVPESRYEELVVDGIRRAVEIAERESVRLALDNHGTVTNDHRFQLRIFESVKSPMLGANLDTMNYRWYGYPVDELPAVFRAIAPYAFHTHMKDGFGSRGDYRGAALGDGEVPLAEAVAALRDAGYDGVWCAEYEGPETEGGAGYRTCVEWLRKNVPAG